MVENPLILIMILIFLLAFSAFFSGSETAFMAISRLRLKYLEKKWPERTRLIEKVLHKPEKLIGTILLGNNLVNIAMSALATDLALSIWGEKGILYVTVFLTIIILIFAEITPKVYSKYYNEKVAMLSAPFLLFFMTAFAPVIKGVTFISTKLLQLGGIDVRRLPKQLFTEAELQTCIRMARDDGEITAREKKILSRVFTLNDKTVEDIMVPFEKIVVVDADMPLRNVIQTISKTGYTRFPVCEGKKSNIIGFLHAKDVIVTKTGKEKESVRRFMRPPYFIPADLTIDIQLRKFQTKRLHQAVVLDKAGKVIGLITLEDIIEELVGAIRDEHDLI